MSKRVFRKWLIIIKIFTVTTLIFGVTNAAQAGGKLITPGLLFGFNDRGNCIVLNAGENPVTVQITIFDSLGGLQDSVTWEIPPNNSRLLNYVAGGSTLLHCVIDIVEGKKRKLRGTFIVSDVFSSFTDSVEAR